MDDIERRMMSTEEINDLPDDAFAYIEPGGTKDAQGKTVPRSLRHFPIHDRAHVENAMARMSQSPHGEHAKKKIMAAAKKYGMGMSDDAERAVTRCCPAEHTFDREWPLDDIVIRAGGDGRTVEAYAAVFGVPTEVKDQHGHYMETIDRAAFNEVLAEGIDKVGCYYHHGMTLHGTPSDLGSVPIGSPVDIRADSKGLRTITRFNKSALADATLEAIRAGDLRGYSFRGPIRKSNPPRIARARDGQPLPTVTRMALGLNEYGPTPTPYYADARILAVRSAQAIATNPVALAELQAELARMLARSTPLDQERDPATPTEGPGAEDQPTEALRSASMHDIRRRIAVFKILGGRKS